MTPPAAAASGRALPRTAVPRAPRRVSGPASRRRTGAAQGAGRRAAAPDPLIVGALHRAQRLSDSRLLDRLVRGRGWIPLVAAALMGIVFMQVTMLKLNAGIGRAVESASTLERKNADLRTEVSKLESGDRIENAAQQLGMVMPGEEQRYLRAGARDTADVAARRMTAPTADAIATTQAGATTGSVVTPGGTSTTATTTAAATTPAVATAPAAATTTTTAATTTGTVTPAVATTPTTQTTTPTTQTAAAPTTQTATQTSATPPPVQQPTTPVATADAAGGAVAPAGN